MKGGGKQGEEELIKIVLVQNYWIILMVVHMLPYAYKFPHIPCLISHQGIVLWGLIEDNNNLKCQQWLFCKYSLNSHPTPLSTSHLQPFEHPSEGYFCKKNIYINKLTCCLINLTFKLMNWLRGHWFSLELLRSLGQLLKLAVLQAAKSGNFSILTETCFHLLRLPIFSAGDPCSFSGNGQRNN